MKKSQNFDSLWCTTDLHRQWLPWSKVFAGKDITACKLRDGVDNVKTEGNNYGTLLFTQGGFLQKKFVLHSRQAWDHKMFNRRHLNQFSEKWNYAVCHSAKTSRMPSTLYVCMERLRRHKPEGLFSEHSSSFLLCWWAQPKQTHLQRKHSHCQAAPSYIIPVWTPWEHSHPCKQFKVRGGICQCIVLVHNRKDFGSAHGLKRKFNCSFSKMIHNIEPPEIGWRNWKVHFCQAVFMQSTACGVALSPSWYYLSHCFLSQGKGKDSQLPWPVLFLKSEPNSELFLH